MDEEGNYRQIKALQRFSTFMDTKTHILVGVKFVTQVNLLHRVSIP